ncbi:ABC1 kinase family protein [Kyrpidia spormannii]|uniref:ABC transporter n=1 Tax=Kyrpidia spormannii TaxID=2055160 RepID=A0ACA8ZAC3_9BACL|nr:AarF/UbiB family protein [Kyrpidia spormannii]CAB3393373.1 ABC transporter [Kyrpidia spormannii]
MGTMSAEYVRAPIHALSLEEKEEISRRIAAMRAGITRGRRYRAIARALSKHGLLHLFQDRGRLRLFGRRARAEEDELRQIGRRLRLVFEELGPTFIKLGQVLVTRQELIPEPITQELAELLDEVPPMPFPYLAAVMEDELPGGLDTFEWIDPDPIGSASLAQVYKAKLKDGRLCAVKVVRPLVGDLFQTDIAIIRRLVRRIQRRLPPRLAASVDLPGLIDDYYSSSKNELDMRIEARNMEEHRRIAAEFETLHVPTIYEVTEHVLVMEYIDGWNLKEFPVDFLDFEERFTRMVDLAHYYIKTFVEGFYHADPHGSNIMIDRHSRKAVMLDWGMVGRMDSLHTEAIFRMLLHCRLNQAEDAAEAALDIIQPTVYTNPIHLKDQLRSMLIHYVNSEQASRYNWGNMVIQIITIGMKNACRIPNGLALWAKGFSAAEGTARWLCPEITYHTVVESADVQILRRWLGRRFNYRANASLVSETAKLIGTLPRRLNKILDRLVWNDLKLVVEGRLAPDVVRSTNRMVSRFTLGLMSAGFFVGGAVLVSSGPAGLAVVPGGRGLAAAVLWGSAVLALGVLWSAFRSRR